MARGGRGGGGGGQGGGEGGEGGEGAEGGQGLTKDYRVFEAMIRKTGAQRLSPKDFQTKLYT